MSERLLTDADVKALSAAFTEVMEEGGNAALAKAFADAMILRLKDEKTVEELGGVWSHHIDRLIGRGVRRMLGYVLLIGAVVGAIKWEAIKYIFLK